MLDGTLVRGLDYYTRTVFEFTSDVLGAQSALGGGGRYDGLVAELGGPETPAVGWAAGIERILLALDETDDEPSLDAFIVAPESQRERALGLATEARRAGACVDLDLAGRSEKGQMKQADRTGARRAVILAEDGQRQDQGHDAPARSARSTSNDVAAEIEREREAGDDERLPGLSANRYRDTWCGGVLADSGDSEVRVAGLGPSPPRPRRTSSSSTFATAPASSSSSSTRTRPARRSRSATRFAPRT